MRARLRQESFLVKFGRRAMTTRRGQVTGRDDKAQEESGNAVGTVVTGASSTEVLLGRRKNGVQVGKLALSRARARGAVARRANDTALFNVPIDRVVACVQFSVRKPCVARRFGTIQYLLR